MVGDDHAVRVAGQVVQHMFGSAEWWLGINDPIFLIERAQKYAEGFLVGQRQALSVKDQLRDAESAAQSSQEFSTVDRTEDQDRQEEVDGCREPALVIERQASTGDGWRPLGL